MYKIIYSEVASELIFSYVDAYEEYQVHRFSDSGLWCEDVILENYKKKSRDIFIAFDEHIRKRLREDTVLGYRPDPTRPGYATLITPIDEYTVIVDYFEDLSEKSRTIEALRIFRG